MKVFVTGINGQLGRDVANELRKRRILYGGADLQDRPGAAGDAISYFPLDITDRDAVLKTIGAFRPDVLIHCAAWTAVDAAEEPENRETVRAVNAVGTAYVAEACRENGSKMLFLSTDYVFDGKGTEPWNPDCVNFHPLNWYGETKLEGERAVAGALDRFFIVRIAWVFGQYGKNFVSTMLNVGKTHDSVRVVNDQVGTPTYTRDLARLLADMVVTDRYGYYHATNEGGYISWYDFACEIFRQAGYPTNVVPVSTKEYGLSKASRPFNSRLDKTKLTENGFSPLPDWRDALKRYLLELDGECR